MTEPGPRGKGEGAAGAHPGHRRSVKSRCSCPAREASAPTGPRGKGQRAVDRFHGQGTGLAGCGLKPLRGGGGGSPEPPEAGPGQLSGRGRLAPEAGRREQYRGCGNQASQKRGSSASARCLMQNVSQPVSRAPPVGTPAARHPWHAPLTPPSQPAGF